VLVVRPGSPPSVERAPSYWSSSATALIVAGASLFLVVAILFCVACFFCSRAKQVRKGSFSQHSKPFFFQGHKPLKTSSPSPECCYSCIGGDKDRDDSQSPDLSFQGHMIHPDSPTFQTGYRDMHLPLRPMLASPSDGVAATPMSESGLVRFEPHYHQPFPQSMTLGNGGNVLGRGEDRAGRAHPGGRWHAPSATMMHLAGGGGAKVVQTPERPLLSDFPSPGKKKHLISFAANFRC